MDTFRFDFCEEVFEVTLNNSEALFKVLAGIAEQDEVRRSSKCLGRERKVIILENDKKNKRPSRCFGWCQQPDTEDDEDYNDMLRGSFDGAEKKHYRRKRKLCERFPFT